MTWGILSKLRHGQETTYIVDVPQRRKPKLGKDILHYYKEVSPYSLHIENYISLYHTYTGYALGTYRLIVYIDK